VSSEPGNLCWLGPVTPVVAQMLARTATADPACEWRVIVTGPTGQAIAVTRVRRTGRRRRATSAAGLISQVTLTVPAGILDGIAAALALSSLDSLGELGEILARAWQSARAAAAEASSSEPTDTCDHRQASPALDRGGPGRGIPSPAMTLPPPMSLSPPMSLPAVGARAGRGQSG
jgi:hypothetical protein